MIEKLRLLIADVHIDTVVIEVTVDLMEHANDIDNQGVHSDIPMRLL